MSPSNTVALSSTSPNRPRQVLLPLWSGIRLQFECLVDISVKYTTNSLPRCEKCQLSPGPVSWFLPELQTSILLPVLRHSSVSLLQNHQTLSICVSSY